jgi:pyrroloquinoline quinone (PQQ) biosynthesis protein C
MFPDFIDLAPLVEPADAFWSAWSGLVDRECHHHAIWSSPFAAALRSDSDAATSFQVAAVWALNMVAGSFCFPRYAAALAGQAESDAIRHALLENAWDESGGVGHTARSHFWLAVRLARLLGASDTDLRKLTPLPAAQAYTDEHYRSCATGSFAEGLGMICLIEEFTTPEFSLVLRALTRTWGEITGRSLDEFLLGGGSEYFTANIADDERHRREMPRIVATWLERNRVDTPKSATSQSFREIRRGMQRSITLRAAFFDEIMAYVHDGGTFATLLAGRIASSPLALTLLAAKRR